MPPPSPPPPQDSNSDVNRNNTWYKPKLIEVGLPLDEINQEASREKSIRHGHPSTLHLWWARRPLAAVRAVIFATLVDDPTAHPDQFPTIEAQQKERERLYNILKRLIKWENSNNEKVLDEAKTEIAKSCGNNPPPILDPFCGGGSIPLEAQRLGLQAHAGDLNPVATLITKAMVEIPPQYNNMPPINPESRKTRDINSWKKAQGLAADVQYYGNLLEQKVKEKIGHLYPEIPDPNGDGKQTLPVIAYLWARTIQSPDPTWNGHVPLVTTWVIRSKKEGNNEIYISPHIDKENQTISYSILSDGIEPPKPTIRRRKAYCIATNTVISERYLEYEAISGNIRHQLLALVLKGQRRKKYTDKFSSYPEIPEPLMIPEQLLPRDCIRDVNVFIYGFDRWGDLFRARQLYFMSSVCETLEEIIRTIEQDAKLHTEPTAGLQWNPFYRNTLKTYLAIITDKVAQYNNSLCSWHKGRNNIRDIFSVQAIRMKWDYAEANPLSGSTGSLNNMIEWVRRAILELPCGDIVEVENMDAVELVGKKGNSVIVTDPPYYSNICYSDLSDFFYVWLRQNLKDTYLGLFETLLTPKREELTSDENRHETKEEAKRFFEEGMRKVFQQTARAQNSDYPAAFFYAYKQEETTKEGDRVSTGWETFLQGLVDSGLAITATYPMRTEMSNRSLALGKNALASSVVVICRQKPANTPMATRKEFMATLHNQLPDAIRVLIDQNIRPVDLAQSAIGPGMAIYSQFSKIIEADGTELRVRDALAAISQTLSNLGMGFDPVTNFAHDWYAEHKFNPGIYDDALKLARGNNISVGTIERSGVLKSGGGKARLLKISELDPKWKPIKDKRLTIWEITHQLIRALRKGEMQSAEIVRAVGSELANKAKELAHGLYQLNNRLGDPQAAHDYDQLISGWPQIIDLAQDPEQGAFDIDDLNDDISDPDDDETEDKETDEDLEDDVGEDEDISEEDEDILEGEDSNEEDTETV